MKTDNFNTKYLDRIAKIHKRYRYRDEKIPNLWFASYDDWEKRNRPFRYYYRIITMIICLLLFFILPALGIKAVYDTNKCDETITSEEWFERDCDVRIGGKFGSMFFHPPL